ncbi:T9SS C-terminal target domain-containing protein [Chryseobacterium arthrosphaerae]|uniref:T9SS type A sorting domain-containing protein n=1 Tax=Chryseobacterium arthrosphaerae TaxID=651561 RepID=UPI000F4FA995|nr:T9SS type A sorting domain-containing protein [Chryseobacterium arthrosphaerae]AYZ12274.1 T9SS C-terminal target domain-containing protein [Chryseobacterium arthrosphaerae]
MTLKITSLILGSVLCCSNLLAQESTFEVPANRWIKENSRNLGIQNFSKLTLYSVRKGHTGETLRYQQFIKEVPVFQSEVLVHFNKEGKISYTSSESLKKNLKEIDITPAISAADAFQKAYVASKSQGEITYQENKLFVYITDGGNTKLVYRVVINSYDNSGSWETIVDAKTGEIISVKDIAVYHRHKDETSESPKKKTKQPNKTVSFKASGSGYVYDPDPLSRTGSTYGGSYVDGNDATNASLDNARSLVTLSDIEFANNVYKLKNSYVEIRNITGPNTGLFTQDTNQFLFNRSELGFEAVNAFWHIDKSLRYINETLGITCKPATNGGVVLYDPHALNGQDNSRYSTAGTLEFGQGGVDDAEDADVILHELGHGIHHWLSGGVSNADGLSEGSGDYWAQSYSRSLNQWASSTPQYNWVFSWDGHNTIWDGRITNTTMTYPGSGSFYDKAQIWSTCLMRIYDRIGKEKTDRAFLEGLDLTTSSTNQQDAAIAVRQAAIDMLGQFGFTCNDINIMTEEFTTSGYVLPEYACQALSTKEIKKEQPVSIYPNPVSDFLNISLKGNKEEKVEIYNMEGRKVIDAAVGNGRNQINVSRLQPGSYIITIKNLEISAKFIKK